MAYQDIDRGNSGHSKFVTLATSAVLCAAGAVFGAMIATSTLGTDDYPMYSNSFAAKLDTPAEAMLPWYSQQRLPKKAAVEYVTPRKVQGQRGTCWDFATMGVLEQSYRSHGVEMGWLQQDEYVSFSEQAYGKLMIDVCSRKDTQGVCRVPGDEVAANSTEGGEVPYLYYLADLLEDKVLPHSVCPYIPTPTTEDGNKPDGVCPGFEDAIETNPILFHLNDMKTMYESMEVKAVLMSSESGRAMAFSTAIPMTYQYYPCTGWRASLPECDATSPLCEPCPKHYTPTACCVRSHHGSNYNMDGEFHATPFMQIEGGHAMLLVGYNDNFKTQGGSTGGFIVKNSWFDEAGHPNAPPEPRGSHTIDWWLQERSDWDERKVCPNSLNPFNWYKCGNTFEVVLKDQHESSMIKAFENCLAEKTISFAALNLQPLRLRCVQPGACDDAKHMVYYAKNETKWGDGMHKRCFFKHDTSDPSASLEDTVSELCLEGMRDRDVVEIFHPVPEEMRYNDPDRCGFYFVPYDVIDQYVMNFGGFFVSSFEVSWHPRSYLANAKYYGGVNYGSDHHQNYNATAIREQEKAFYGDSEPEFGDSKAMMNKVLDYSLIKDSTKKQRNYSFSGPFPNAP